MKKSGIAAKAMASGATTCASSIPSATETSVPAVPGATGDKPAPKPSAMKCAGCETRKRASGRSGEVVVSAAIDLHGLAVRAEQAHTLAALDLADARERHAQHVGELRDAFPRIGRRGEAQLVVVAAGDDRRAARVALEMLRADGGNGNGSQVYCRAHSREAADVAEVGEQAIGDV